MLQTYLIDTNIFLDLILERSGADEAEETLRLFGKDQDLVPSMSSHCLATIFYVGRREIGKEAVLSTLKGLLLFIRLAPLDERSALKSFSYGMSDFEDALQAASAEAIGAVGIITRNTKDFKKSPVPCLTPAEFIAQHGSP